MMNVLSFKQATRQGLEASLYAFDARALPPGCYRAKLVAKVWAKKVMGISCYFETGSGIKVQLTVYCRFEDGRYCVPGSAVDFSSCATDRYYTIRVAHRGAGLVFTGVTPDMGDTAAGDS